MNIFLVTQQMLILFAMMAVGYLVYRLGWIDNNTSSRLSKLVVNIFNPVLMISSIFGKTISATGVVFWENLVLVIAFYALLFLLGFLVVFVLRPNSTDSPIYRMMTLLPNCGFMGIPVVTALLGKEYVLYVAIYMLGYSLLMYTYGIYLAKKTSPAPQETLSLFQKFKPIFFNSGVIASIVALVIFFWEIPVHHSLQTLCNYLGNPCIPLSMMLIGCSLAASDLKSMLKNIRIYGFLIIKLLCIPIAFAFAVRFLPFEASIEKVFLIMAAMPAGSMVVLVTEQYGGKADCASSGVTLSTLASIATIPIVSFFF